MREITTKKRVLALFLALLMVLSVIPFREHQFVQAAGTITPQAPTVGDGTTDSPYEIGTKEELYWFADYVNQGGNNRSACAKLTADITVNDKVFTSETHNAANLNSDLIEWTPIGAKVEFWGQFDGQGHSISGLYQITGDAAGLFGKIYLDASIKNVAVKDSYISATDNRVGAVVGLQYSGEVTGCFSTGCCIETTDTSYNPKIGGITGYINPRASVKACYTDMDKVTGYDNDSQYENCVNHCCYNGCGHDMASGESAYYMNGEVQGGTIWYQNIDNGNTKDSYPVTDAAHGKVYRDEDTGNYTNSPAKRKTTMAVTNLENGTLPSGEMINVEVKVDGQDYDKAGYAYKAKADGETKDNVSDSGFTELDSLSAFMKLDKGSYWLKVTVAETEEIKGASEIFAVTKQAGIICEVTTDQGTTEYGTFVEGWDRVKTDSGTLKLMSDITLKDTYEPDDDKQDITIDLNGHTWSYTGSECALNASKGILTMKDSSEQQTGRMVSDSSKYLLCQREDNYKITRTLNITGGTYELTNTKEKAVITLYFEEGGTINITGGVFRNAATDYNSYSIRLFSPNTLNMSGGCVETGTCRVYGDNSKLTGGYYNKLYAPETAIPVGVVITDSAGNEVTEVTETGWILDKVSLKLKDIIIESQTKGSHTLDPEQYTPMTLEVKVTKTKADSTDAIEYQWYRKVNGEAAEKIAGATTSTYKTPESLANGKYEYYCVTKCGSTELTSESVTVEIVTKERVAEVRFADNTTRKFITIEEAFDAAKDGSTVTLLTNVSCEESNAGKPAGTVTFDLNGYVLRKTGDFILNLADTQKFILKDSKGTGSLRSDEIQGGNGIFYNAQNTEIVVESGELMFITNLPCKSLTVNGGTVRVHPDMVPDNCLISADRITISGGAVYGTRNSSSPGSPDLIKPLQLKSDKITVSGGEFRYVTVTANDGSAKQVKDTLNKVYLVDANGQTVRDTAVLEGNYLEDAHAVKKVKRPTVTIANVTDGMITTGKVLKVNAEVDGQPYTEGISYSYKLRKEGDTKESVSNDTDFIAVQSVIDFMNLDAGSYWFKVSVAEGVETLEKDEVFAVAKAGSVCEVKTADGSKQYGTLAEGWNAVNANGGTLTLLEDVKVDECYALTNDVTVSVNLKGHTWKDESAKSDAVLSLEKGTLIILDSGKTGKLSSGKNTLVSQAKDNSGMLVIDGGTYELTGKDNETSCIELNGGTAKINGGVFKNPSANSNAVAIRIGEGSVRVNGGSVEAGKFVWTDSSKGSVKLAGGSYVQAEVPNSAVLKGVLVKDTEGKVLTYEDIAALSNITLELQEVLIAVQPGGDATYDVDNYQPATLEVTAEKTETETDAEIYYQWYQKCNDTAAVAIENATAKSYQTPDTLPAGTYQYYCVVQRGKTKVTSDTVTIKIVKKDITPVVTIENWTYGDTAKSPAVDAAGNPGNGAVAYTYYTDADCKTKTTEDNGAKKAGEVPANAGTYYVKAAVEETDYYNAGTTKAVSFTIEPKTVEVEWNDTTLVYTGKAQGPSATVKAASLIGTDVCSVKVSGQQTDTNAKTGQSYTATAESLSNANYKLPDTKPTTNYTIQPKPITCTPDNVKKHIGKEEPKLTYTVTGLAEGDTLSGITLQRESGEDAKTYTTTATQTQGANPNYSIAFGTGTFTVEPHDIGVTKKAVAPTCTENGCTEEIGCRICGEVTTPSTNLDALGHLWAEEWTVTKEATATANGKREKTCRRGDCGQKKIEVIPATGTSQDTTAGQLEKSLEVEKNAPIREAVMNNNKSELLNSDKIFTENERTQILAGTLNAKVWLEIRKADKSALDKETQNQILKLAEQFAGADPKLTFIGMEFFKQIESDPKVMISETGVGIRTTLLLSDDLLNKDSTKNRTYKVIRVHTDSTGKTVVELLDADFNEKTNELSFVTDKFSTYAIVYKDTNIAKGDKNNTPENKAQNNNEKRTSPQTGENRVPIFWTMICLTALAGVTEVSVKRNKKKERQ